MAPFSSTGRQSNRGAAARKSAPTPSPASRRRSPSRSTNRTNDNGGGGSFEAAFAHITPANAPPHPTATPMARNAIDASNVCTPFSPMPTPVVAVRKEDNSTNISNVPTAANRKAPPTSPNGQGNQPTILIEAETKTNNVPSPFEQQQFPTGPAADDICRMRSYVARLGSSLIKENTSLAYDNKQKEYKQYCDYVYHNLHPNLNRYTVTDQKLYKFLFYHVFRSKKKGIRKGSGGVFNISDYNYVQNKYEFELTQIEQNPELVGVELSDPVDPLGHDQIITYRASVHKLYEEQREGGVNNLLWEQINSPSVKALLSVL